MSSLLKKSYQMEYLRICSGKNGCSDILLACRIARWFETYSIAERKTLFPNDKSYESTVFSAKFCRFLPKRSKNHSFLLIQDSWFRLMCLADRSCIFHLQCVSLLLKHGAKVNLKDSSGNTPLHFCCSNGHIGPAILLVQVSKFYCFKDISYCPYNSPVQ